jgi:hypothetical protein
MPKPKSPSHPHPYPQPQAQPQNQPQALQTIDPTALATVSGGARSGRSATSADTSSSGGSSDAVLGALTGILDSLQSLTNQRSTGGFNPEEMMMFMMMMQQRNSGGVQVVQPSLPVIYADGTQRIF